MNDRFCPVIVLSPSRQFDKSEQLRHLISLRAFFNARNISYVDWDENNDCSKADLRVDINPDIIFYPQQYPSAYYGEQRCNKFWNKLLCLCPYGIANEETKWAFNLDFHNRAWKLFYTNNAEL